MERALKSVFAQRPVDAWLWGHEHRCAVYRDPAGLVQFASLVGHGGIPIASGDHGDVKKAPLTYHYQEEDSAGLTNLGFVVVDLSDSSALARYFNEHGVEHWAEEF